MYICMYVWLGVNLFFLACVEHFQFAGMIGDKNNKRERGDTSCERWVRIPTTVRSLYFQDVYLFPDFQ